MTDESRARFEREAERVFALWQTELNTAVTLVAGRADESAKTYLKFSNKLAKAAARADSKLAKERLEEEHEAMLDNYLAQIHSTEDEP